MKKLLCIAFVIFILIGCCSCHDQTQSGNTVDFYYCAKEPNYGNDEGLFFIEKREVTYELHDYQKIIEEYLLGARMDSCISPFPPGTTLVRLSVQNRDISIELSPHMALQSNSDVIVCCACLCKTLFACSDLRSITFSIENHEINGEASIAFDRTSFVNWDMLS